VSRPAHPRRDEAVERLRQGEHRDAVAALVGVSRRTVDAWARALGPRPQGAAGHLAPAQRPAVYAPRGATALHQDGHTAQILEFLAAGWKPPRIAEELGISASAVRQVRAKHASAPAPEQDPAPPPARRAGRR